MGLLNKLKTWAVGAPEDDALPEGRSPRDREAGTAPAPLEEVGMGKVVVVCPGRYVDAGKLADYLCQGYTVLLNLEEASKEAARRIVDFLSGSAYARDGQLLHIACNAYLLAPNGVDVLGPGVDAPPEEDGWEYDDAFGF